MAYREIKVQDVEMSAMLNRNITVAPLHQSYALCIEYMRHWFLQKFNSDFFSWVHTDGSHVFGEMSKLDKKNKGKCKKCGNDIDLINTKLKLSRKRIVK